MRAVVVRQPARLDNLVLADLDEPTDPGPGQVLVKIYASSLNSHDHWVVTHATTQDGRIPMSDGAGVVVAVGQGVTEFSPGDHVVSTFLPNWPDGMPPAIGMSTVPGDGVDGFAREYAIAAAGGFTRVPSGWSHAEAATLTTAGVTAWRSLVTDGPVKAGQTVLTLGTGGVSVIALQLAKTMGATVIATSSSDEKLERLKAIGADHVVNYKATPRWGEAIREISDGGVHHVVEVGGPGTLAQSIEAVRPAGHIALIGVLTGWHGEVATGALMRKRIRLQGVIVGSRRDQLELISAAETAGIRPIIDTFFPMAELADAFRYMESGQHFGKICVEF